MKRTLFLLLLLSLTVSLAGAEEIPTESTIKAVTLYPGSARVTRQAVVKLIKGTHKILLTDIISSIDGNSLSVSGSGSGKFRIHGANLKREHKKEETNQRRQELLKQLEQIQDDIAAAQNRLLVVDAEKNYLNSIRLFSGNQIPKDLVTSMPTVETLSATQKYLSEGFTKLMARQEETLVQIREMNQKKDLINRQLNELNNNNRKWSQSVEVDVECLAEGTLTIDASYLVHGANWRPVYDARTHLDKGEVELNLYGMITQNTGEDWKDVALTLSTAQPALYGRMPYIAPWVINPVEQIRRKTARKAMLAGTMQTWAFSDKMDMEMDEAMPSAPAEQAFAQVSQKGLSVTFDIPLAATILSDGSENKAPIATQTLNADFNYAAFPKSSAHAYLGSRVTNSDKLQLLAGAVNLFLEGDFIGNSSIDGVAPSEKFDLYLGVDDNVKVKREELSKKVDDVLLGGIPSPKKKITYEYKLTVENYKDKPVLVKLFESMPTSGNDKIKVKILDISTKPTKKDWKDRQGVWLWKIHLKPGEKKEITYAYFVEFPRDMEVNL